MPVNPSTELRAADRYFTSREVGDILQVNASSIVKWINDGRLEAFRTPGGHRRVAGRELVRFAREHGMPVPEILYELAVSKVVAVDEEPRFLAALLRAFKPYDREFSLQTAENGIDALMLTGALRPDVLILDLQAPGIDGLAVLERLKLHPDTRSMSVVATGHRMNEATADRCHELGAANCFSKPVRAPKLVEALRNLRRPRAR